MLNKEKIEIHLHLFYRDTSLYILEQLSKVWNTRINVSLIDGAAGNQEIIAYMESNFPGSRHVYVDNLGSDQNGFYESFQENSEGKEWILYAHDKNPSKQSWLEDILLPLLNHHKVNQEILNSETGLISANSKKWLLDLETEQSILEEDKKANMSYKRIIVLKRHTLVWLRELQYILYKKHGFIQKENLNFKFTAGTMFLAKRDVVDLSLSCILPCYFEECYRQDGNVQHAMERFYYYVSMCLGYENKFI